MHTRILVFLTILPIAAAAQDKKEDWPEGSAMHSGFLAIEQREVHMKALEQAQEGLMRRITSKREFPDERLFEAVRAQHRAWLVYRDAECELVGSLTGAGGSWPSTHAVSCEAQLTGERLTNVSAANTCIDALSADERDFGINDCLYRLGVLADHTPVEE